MEDAPLASLSLTHVHYNPDDLISYFCAWLALVPQGLCVIYITLIWASREVEIILMFTGQMGCEALNFLLKRLIKEERPKMMYGKGYGMPSSHAQFMAFYSISLALFLLFRYTPAMPTKSSVKEAFPYSLWPSLKVQRFFVSGLALLVAINVSMSRIYLNYHTPKQVLVGCSAGAVSAVAWFGCTSWLRYSGLLAKVLDLELSQWLRLRDLIVEEDLVEAGWKEWETRNKHKKNGKARKTL